MGVSKDRARPFSRKHRKYWIPVTGGMILIGIANVALGYCTYTPPSDVHEKIVLDVPNARSKTSAPPAAVAVPCAPALEARIAQDMPGAAIVACSPTEVTVARNAHTIVLEVAGDQIVSVAEQLTLPEIPAPVMRTFAVTYPKTIPASATRRTRRGEPAIYELAFPAGATHKRATLQADGSVIDVQ